MNAYKKDPENYQDSYDSPLQKEELDGKHLNHLQFRYVC